MKLLAEIESFPKSILWLFVAFTAASCLLSFYLEETFLLALPALVLVSYFTFCNYKAMFFVLLFALPLSIEYYFNNGLATDLPTEPLMIGLTLVTILLMFRNSALLPKGFLTHPIIIVLGLHYFWFIMSGINGTNLTISTKIFLAKTWYIVPFTFLTAILFKSADDLIKLFWCIFIPLTIEVILTMIRHGVLYGFAFDEINNCVTPYFRNHVNYAAMASIFFPFLFLARRYYSGSAISIWLTFSILLYIVAIYFSYTRTCMLALLAMIPVYFVIRFNLMKWAVSLGFVALLAAGFFLFHNNRYLEYAPTYEETIYHDDFSTHMSSTFEGKDVSSMERIYRWIAAIKMFPYQPWMGVGPGNFFDNYKKYSVSKFETYISDNEERSTVHNYFLLLLSEQGAIGLGIFGVLTMLIFLYCQKLYNQFKNPANKFYAIILSLIAISLYVNLSLSDLMEADKVGPFYFMLLSFIVLADRRSLLLENE